MFTSVTVRVIYIYSALGKRVVFVVSEAVASPGVSWRHGCPEIVKSKMKEAILQDMTSCLSPHPSFPLLWPAICSTPRGFTVVVYTGVDKNTGQETIERVYCTSPLRISQGVIWTTWWSHGSDLNTTRKSVHYCQMGSKFSDINKTNRPQMTWREVTFAKLRLVTNISKHTSML